MQRHKLHAFQYAAKVIDTHCHLDYLEDPETALQEEHVSGVVCIGASLEHAKNAISFAEKHPHVWATVGLHPTSADEDNPENRRQLEALALHPRVVGIGESGLDDFHDNTQRRAQMAALEWQLDLANRLNKILVLHVRDKTGESNAHRGLLEELRRWPNVRLLFHCFSGNDEALRFAMEHDCYIGFAGNVTYKKATEIQYAATAIDASKILLETDAPFLAPVPHRGKKNRPAFAWHTLQKLAELRGVTVEEMHAQTTKNAQEAYGFSLP